MKTSMTHWRHLQGHAQNQPATPEERRTCLNGNMGAQEHGSGGRNTKCNRVNKRMRKHLARRDLEAREKTASRALYEHMCRQNEAQRLFDNLSPAAHEQVDALLGTCGQVGEAEFRRVCRQQGAWPVISVGCY